MDDIHPPSRLGLWAIASGLLLIPIFIHPMANPDIFWHLKAAEIFLESGAIARSDLMSYTRLGDPWVNFEWLIQLIYYGIYRLAGFPGLLVLKAFLIALAALPIWALSDLHRIKPPLRAAFMLFWGALILGRSDLKPETFSVILFSLELYFLEARRLKRIPLLPTYKELLGICVFFAFWANLHLAFVSGILLLAAYGIDRSETPYFQTCSRIAAALTGTLINPYGLGLYRVLWEHAQQMGIITQFIFEWQPPRLDNPYDWPAWVLIGLSVAVLIAQTSWNRRPPAEHLAAGALFGAMYLAHSRQSAFLIPVGLLILMDASKTISTWLRRLRLDMGRFVLIIWIFLYIGYTASLAQPHLLKNGAFAMGLLPEKPADFIEKELAHLRKRRVFNQWGWGGYLSYRFHPEIRVFMDGRYIFHPFLQEVATAHDGPLQWQNFLLKHNIEWVLVRNNTASVRVSAPTPENNGRTVRLPFMPTYYPSRRWAAVYRDQQAILYARRGAFPEDWILKHEIR